MSQLKLFIPINKIDEEQRLVYGTVAAQVKDNSGETFDYEASKPYFEKWSNNAHATSNGQSYGNLRVMHTAKVAGKIDQPLAFNDDEKTIEAVAKVVDDDEWQKVVTGCYTGFSMGGRYVERVKKGEDTHYTADPVEISLVDKPCIPTATFSVIKADGVIEERHFAEEVLLKGYNPDQERDERGRFAGGGGGSEGPTAEHGGSDGSGHGADRSVADIRSDMLAGREISAQDRATVTSHTAKEAANRERAAVQRQSGKDPKALRAVAVQHEHTAANYRAIGSHEIASQVAQTAEHLHSMADKWEKSDTGDLAKADDKPYGDVKYADPGYQEDGKERYPIDTEDHIRSAWNYISRKSNADKYTADQVEKIKAKIVAAWKKTIDKDGPPSAEKADIGDSQMRTPTNDEMLPVARDLAKAAGKDPTHDWPEFMDAARDQLMKADGEHDMENCDKADCPDCAAMKAAMEKGEMPQSVKDKIDGKDKKDDKSGDAKDDGKDGDGKDAEDGKDKKDDKPDDDAKKFDTVAQFWQAGDGSLHVRKADAIKANQLAKAAATSPGASVIEQLQGMKSQVSALAKGETVEAPAGPKPFQIVADEIAAAMTKYTAYLGADVLTKSMYQVSRMADIVSCLEGLHCSLSWDAKYEGDDSPVPGMSLDALRMLCTLLTTMAEEEVKELLTRAGAAAMEAGAEVMEVPEVAELMELSASTLGLEKADLAPLLKKADAPAVVEKVVADPELVAKADAAEKRASEAVAQVELYKSDMDKIGDLLKGMQEEIAVLKATPLPKAPTTVVKTDEIGIAAGAGGQGDLLKKFTPSQLADAAIRLSHAHGVSIKL